MIGYFIRYDIVNDINIKLLLSSDIGNFRVDICR